MLIFLRLLSTPTFPVVSHIIFLEVMKLVARGLAGTTLHVTNRPELHLDLLAQALNFVKLLLLRVLLQRLLLIILRHGLVQDNQVFHLQVHKQLVFHLLMV